MKKNILGLIGGLVMLASVPAQADSAKNLVTIVTSPNAQTQLMAMVLTMQAVKQGAAAHILLCGEAGDMALKDAPATVTAPQKPKGMSPQGLMGKIMANTDTKVEVCAIYLPNKGIDTSALLEGITAANPAEMAGRLMADDARIMSF
jgi:predicted peroxiredoxin